MRTLFQLHADLNTLKYNTYELSQLWHSGDQILLIGATAMLIDWLQAYITDINVGTGTDVGINNSNEEGDKLITGIDGVFILESDLTQINDTAKANIDVSQFKLATVKTISDSDWVALTQQAGRVITLY